MVLDSGMTAARWAINDDGDPQDYTGEAMREEFGDLVELHRERVLEYAAWLPDYSTAMSVRDVENTGDLLNALAVVAVDEDVYRVAWRAVEFYRTVEQERAERESLEAVAE